MILDRNPKLRIPLKRTTDYFKSTFPFCENGFFFYGYGRYALYEGIQCFGLKPGSKVLLPELICHVVMAAIYAARLEAVFYRVNDDLEPDWDELEGLIDPQVKALMVVNYFGFPNNWSQSRIFTDKHQIFLIEDNAHGFLSKIGEHDLGSFGDLSIFSFQKSTRIPSGAGLLIRNSNIKIPCKNTAQAKLMSVSKFLVKELCGVGRNSLSVRNILKLDSEEAEANQEFSLTGYDRNIDCLSRYILQWSDFNLTVETRRSMFLQWLSFFRNQMGEAFRPVFDELPAGVAPLVFPVTAADPAAAIAKFRALGIEAYLWPQLPRCNNRRHEVRKIICLPVHNVINISNVMHRFK